VTTAPEVVRAAAERAARGAYGRLTAWLAWQWRDIAAAEDALSEAFVAALSTWPRDGVPASPEGWLLTAAKRQLLKAARRDRLAADPTLTVLFPRIDEEAEVAPALPDARLRLMLVCAHPAIDAPVRTALMLQTVIGLEAQRIAPAFLVSAEAMTKRLVRAKAKIRSTGIRFETPGPDEWPERIHHVLEAIYAAYTLDSGPTAETGGGALAAEALYLCELVDALCPDEPEAAGLHALLRACEARRAARLDASGRIVPLDRQDPRRWDRDALDEADRTLMRAAGAARPGPFQLEAAIQSAHASRRFGGPTPWSAIATLYERLLALAPTVGARIGHAMAIAQARDDPKAGLALLDAIVPAPHGHQPWWAVRAWLLERDGDTAAAAPALERAIALARDPAVRAHLSDRLAALDRGAERGA
jgi:RNA polymerase sigma-70 factor, ECF subfamily